MKASTFTYKDQDGVDIFVYKWAPDKSAKAAIQIEHGMAEHAKRYEGLAELLCKEGFICYADDHRGHGRTAGDLTTNTLKDKAGVLGPNGWQGTLNAIHELTKIIKNENPNIPLFLIGHSWGSFLSQNYIQEWGTELKGVVLSGSTGKQNALLLKAGKFLAKKQIKKIGPTAPSELLDKMSIKSYNKKWKGEAGATGKEWLSRDKEVVKKYVSDPWCGFIVPATFMLEMMNAFGRIWDPINEHKIPKDLPVFMIAGTDDPVSRGTKDLLPLLNRYNSYNIKDVTYKFYVNARHEVFNEINREEVIKDVINWLNAHMK